MRLDRTMANARWARMWPGIALGVLLVGCGGHTETDATGGSGGALPAAGSGGTSGSGGTPGDGGQAATGSGGQSMGGASHQEPLDLSLGDGIVFPMDPLLEVDGTDVIVSGQVLYPREFGLDTEAAGDSYVLRIDENLELVDSFRFSGAGPSVMAKSGDGTIAIAGTLWTTTKLGDQTHEATEDAYYVAWLNRDLELLRSVVVESEPTTWLYDAVFDQDDGVVVVGSHNAPVDVAPYTHQSLTVVSLDETGSELWNRRFEGTGSTAWASDAELMPDGSILLVGGFNHTLTFGEDVLDSGGDSYEGLFVRLSASDGAPVLAESFGGADYQYAFDAWVTDADSVLVSGSADGSFSFGGLDAEGHGEGGLFFAEVSDAAVASGLLALAEASHGGHVLGASPQPRLIASFDSPQRIALGTWTETGLVSQTIVQDEDAYMGEAALDSEGHIWLTTQFLDSIELPVGSFRGEGAGTFANDWVLWRFDPETL